jgi:DNA-binding NarL/FixJ family response regulator
MAKIRVLIIEDNRLLRDGTTALLNEQADIKAVSSPANRTVLEKAKKLRPEVVVLDLGLKSVNSLKVLEMVKKQHPKAKIVVMSLLPSETEVADVAKVGITGYVPKDATLKDFLRTIRSAVKGVKTLPPTISESLISQIVKGAVEGRGVRRVMDAIKLTKQEQRIVNRLAEAETVVATAQKLKVDVLVVKGHVRNVVEKLALHARLNLAVPASKKE